MATNAAEIEFIPEEPITPAIEFIPDDTGAPAIEFIPDEPSAPPSQDLINREALRGTAAALQAMDVMAAPRQFDWSEANEQMDLDRFRAAGAARAEARLLEDSGGSPEQVAELRKQADFQESQISPYTTVGQERLRQLEGNVQAAGEIMSTVSRRETPSDVLRGFMGPGLAAQGQVAVETGARGIGAALGGAAGAARFIPHPGANVFAQIALPMAGALLGGQTGAYGQEALLQSTETPEETQARQVRGLQEEAAAPGQAMIGRMAANLPFFRPGLAQLGQAAAGDIGAIRNLGIAGTLGAVPVIAGAAIRGEKIRMEDVAEAFFSNVVMNEPTRLGRLMGLTPSNEQARAEALAAGGEMVPSPVGPQRASIGEMFPYGPGRTTIGEAFPLRAAQEQISIPIGENIPVQPGEPNAQQISQASPPDGGVCSPEVAPENAPVPTPESSEGVQPSRQGEPLVEGTPEAAREVVPQRETKPDSVEVLFDGDTIDATESLRDRFDSKRRTALVFRFPEEKPQLLYRGISERELKALQSEPDKDILGGKYSVPAEREYGAQYALTPEEAMRAAFHDEKAKGVEGEKKFLITVDARGRIASHLDPRPTTTPELSEKMRYLIPADRISGNLGVSVRVPFREVLSVEEIVRAGKGYAKKETPSEPPVTPPPAEPSVTPPPAEPPPTAAPAPQPPTPDATSIKNAQVDAERAQRGLPPMDAVVPVADQVFWQQAKDAVAADAALPARIVAEVIANPRSLSPEETMVLLHERVRLRSDYNKASAEYLAAKDAGDEATAIARKADADVASAKLLDLELATGRGGAGTEQARAFRLRQLFAKEDYSLAELVTKARMAKGGEALTEAEQSQVQKVAEDFAKQTEKVDAAEAAAKQDIAAQDVDDVIKSTAAQVDPEPAVKSLADRIIAKLDAQAQSARQRLRERFKKVGSFPDPVIVADLTILAANRIAKSAVKASQWVAEMVKEFGEGVRPYLMQAYEAADKQLDVLVAGSTADKKKRSTVKAKILAPAQQQERVTNAIANRIKEGEKIGDLTNYVGRLAESFVAGGIKDRDSLVTAVKGALEPIVPDITTETVVDLISGYGQSRKLSKDPVKVTKRQLAGELLQVSKLNKLAAGEPLQKTGPERRTPGDEERRLIREVNEAKKKAGVTTTDPETQLKSTMDAARTRFRNQIKDLTFEIETGQRPPDRTPVQYEQDVEILRGLRDRLKEVVNFIDGPRKPSEEQRIQASIRGLEASLAAKKRLLAGQKPEGKPLRKDTPREVALKAEIEAINAQIAEMRAADATLAENRKAEALVRSIEKAEAELSGSAEKRARVQGPESQLVAEARAQLAGVREQLQAKRAADPEAIQERMDRAEAAVEKSIKELDRQIQSGDISVKQRPSAPMSQRLEDLRMQRDAMIRLRQQLRREARPKPNPLDIAAKAREAQLKKQLADLEARIAAGDFARRPRKEPRDLSMYPAVMDAKAEVQKVKDRFDELQQKWELAQRTWPEKVYDGVRETWNAVTRNLKLSFDLSAPIQTAFAMAAHPVEGVKAIGAGARAFAEQMFLNSDKYARRLEQQIINSPNFKEGLYKDMKLDLSSVTGKRREENAGSIMERFADLDIRWKDTPDFVKDLFGLRGQQLVQGAAAAPRAAAKLLGMGIKASNAGFGAIANQMRVRTADAILRRAFARRGKPSKQYLELVGNYINAATGKGGLQGERAINALLFAPNYYLSIIKQLTLQPLAKAGLKQNAGAAREIFEEYVRAAITATMVGTLAYLFGDRDRDMFNPQSRDFGRFFTDQGTSVDLTLGRGSWVSTAYKIITGKRENAKGQLEDLNRKSEFLQFLGGRLSPSVATGLTTVFGENFKGQPIEAGQMVRDLVMPLSWRDVDKVLEAEGLTRGTFLQILNLLGLTYRVETE